MIQARGVHVRGIFLAQEGGITFEEGTILRGIVECDDLGVRVEKQEQAVSLGKTLEHCLRHIKEHQASLAELAERIETMWYCPGMPGMEAAATSFAADVRSSRAARAESRPPIVRRPPLQTPPRDLKRRRSRRRRAKRIGRAKHTAAAVKPDGGD
jgi:hypothetical protein